MTDDSDTRLLAALSELDQLAERHGVAPRELLDAWREAHEAPVSVPAPIPENMVGLVEAAKLLDTTPRALRRAVLDRTWSPETPAPIYRRSPAGLLWAITQVSEAARAQHEKQASRGLQAAIQSKPSRGPKQRAYVAPADTGSYAAPWEQSREAAA